MSDQAILVRFSTSLREKKRERERKKKKKDSFFKLKVNRAGRGRVWDKSAEVAHCDG